MVENGSPSPFHMVELNLDVHRLVGLGRMLGLMKMRGPTDTDYLVHCALSELFQQQAPKPFWISGNAEAGRLVRVLGYTQVEGSALNELAKGFASPQVYEIVHWNRMASKPMPDVFLEGMRFAFEVRVCPVVRKASEGVRWKKGQEIDAFLDRVWTINDPSVVVDREKVYGEWFNKQLERSGGVHLEAARIDHLGLDRLIRRDRSRASSAIMRPDVTIKGILKVTDGPAFGTLLRRGVGRHRSFGFGMLRLRRA